MHFDLFPSFAVSDVCECAGKFCEEMCRGREMLLSLWREINDIPISECPRNWSKAILFDLYYVSGMGHHLHQLLHGMTLSLMYRRPLVVMDYAWGYAGPDCKREPKITCFFRPLNPCKESDIDLRGLHLPPRRAVLSSSVPYSELRGRAGEKPLWVSSRASEHWVSDELRKVFSTFTWSPSRFVKKLLTQLLFHVSPEMEEFLKSRVFPHIKLVRPMVGVHIRRTDKLSREAKKYEVQEYFEHVDRFYAGMRNSTTPVPSRPTVFIATDDPSAVARARHDYGAKYSIVNLAKATEIANKRNGRLTAVVDEGTCWTIADILLLANSDFLVGTFSSQISRLAFELMAARVPHHSYEKQQNRKPDMARPSWKGARQLFQIPKDESKTAPVMAVSLDDYYYIGSMFGD